MQTSDGRRKPRRPGLSRGPFFTTAEAFCTCESCTAAPDPQALKAKIGVVYPKTKQESKTNG